MVGILRGLWLRMQLFGDSFGPAEESDPMEMEPRQNMKPADEDGCNDRMSVGRSTTQEELTSPDALVVSEELKKMDATMAIHGTIEGYGSHTTEQGKKRSADRSIRDPNYTAIYAATHSSTVEIAPVVDTGKFDQEGEDSKEDSTRFSDAFMQNDESGDENSSIIKFVCNEERKGLVRCSAFDLANKPVSVYSWAKIMTEDSHRGETVRRRFNDIVKSAPFKGMFFETKAVTAETSSTENFEFVLINSPSLFSFGQRGADPESFGKHFKQTGDLHSVTFYNLAKDALLIAPKPLSNNLDCYAHLAQFVRHAPQEQIMSTWQMVASEYLNILHDPSPGHPVWLSTSGLGVAWLHFRLDSSPKYYQHMPFTHY